MITHLHNLKIEKRKKAREIVIKSVNCMKKQNALLSELYLLPNEIAIKKSDEFLKGRISLEQYRLILADTRKRYSEILNLKLELKE